MILLTIVIALNTLAVMSLVGLAIYLMARSEE